MSFLQIAQAKVPYKHECYYDYHIRLNFKITIWDFWNDDPDKFSFLKLSEGAEIIGILLDKNHI